MLTEKPPLQAVAVSALVALVEFGCRQAAFPPTTQPANAVNNDLVDMMSDRRSSAAGPTDTGNSAAGTAIEQVSSHTTPLDQTVRHSSRASILLVANAWHRNAVPTGSLSGPGTAVERLISYLHLSVDWQSPARLPRKYEQPPCARSSPGSAQAVRPAAGT